MSSFSERLAAIDRADQQMELLVPLANELLDSDERGADIASAILAMYERNAGADGYGTFATLNMVLEEIEPEILEPLVEASLARQPSWPVRELAAMFG